MSHKSDHKKSPQRYFLIVLTMVAQVPNMSWCAFATTDLFSGAKSSIGSMTNGSTTSSAISSLRYRDICTYNDLGTDKTCNTHVNLFGSDVVANESSNRMLHHSEGMDADVRACWICMRGAVFQGIASDHEDGRWVAFFCKNCVPHLSVRHATRVLVPGAARARAERARISFALTSTSDLAGRGRYRWRPC